jgi:hypothetical protein
MTVQISRAWGMLIGACRVMLIGPASQGALVTTMVSSSRQMPCACRMAFRPSGPVSGADEDCVWAEPVGCLPRGEDDHQGEERDGEGGDGQADGAQQGRGLAVLCVRAAIAEQGPQILGGAQQAVPDVPVWLCSCLAVPWVTCVCRRCGSACGGDAGRSAAYEASPLRMAAM